MPDESSRFRKLPGPCDAYRRAQVAAVDAITMSIPLYGGVGAAISGLAIRYRLSRAWLRRLWDGNHAAVALDQYERLVAALEDAAERQRAAADLAKARCQAVRGANAAVREDHGPRDRCGSRIRSAVSAVGILDQEVI